MVKVVFRAIAALCVLILTLAPRTAQAIPAFARRYETTCQTCHLAYPKLTPFGEAFRRNGYRFPGGGDATAEKEEPLPLGTEAHAELWPMKVFPGKFPRSLPLSIVLGGKVTYGTPEGMHGMDMEGEEAEATSEHSEVADLNFGSLIDTLWFRSGGTAGDHISYLAAINIIGDEGLEVERANAIFLPLKNPATLLIKVGRFEPAQHGVTVHRGLVGHQLRLTMTAVGDNPFTPEPYHDGLELSGVAAARFGWAAGVVENATPGMYIAKDAYGRIEGKIGGMTLDGSGSWAGTAPWRETSLILGASTWVGRSMLEDATAMHDDNFVRIGVDAHAVLGDLLIDAVVAEERHGNPDLVSDGPTNLDQVFAEVTWVALPVFFPTARFEASRTWKTTPGGDLDWLGLVTANAVVHPNVLLRAEVGLGAEPGEMVMFKWAGLAWSLAY